MKLKLPKLSVTVIIVTLNMTVFACMICMQWESVLVPTKQMLIDMGANYGLYTLSGQYLRLITSLFVHVGVLHLAINSYVLLELGGNFEKRYGWRRMLYVYLFCGICSGLASAGVDPLNISAGASGAIFGVYGHYLGTVAISTKTAEERAALKQQSILALALILGNTVYGAMNPGMDNVAHIGGFLTGVATGLFARLLKAHRRTAVIVSVSIIACLLWVDKQLFVARAYDQYYEGIVAKKEGLFPRGERAFTKFIDGNSKEPDAFGLRAYCRMKTGDLDGALHDFDRMIELDPANPGPYNDRAWVLAGLKNYQRAVDDASKCIKLNPKTAAPYDTRGYALARLGNYDKALADFSEAIKLSANDPAAYFHRAQIYEKLGNADKAQPDHARAAKYQSDPWESDLDGNIINSRHG